MSEGRILTQPLPLPIGAAAVEIDQDVPWFGAFAGANNAAPFQFVHDAGGAGVTKAEPALHERDAGFLFAANDLDALLDEAFVLVAGIFVADAGDGLGKLLVNFHFVARFTLPGDVVHDAFDFLIGDEDALGAVKFGGAGREIKHVAFAEQFIGAHGIENGAGVDLGGNLESDTGGDVRLDDAGDDVNARALGGDNAMNAGSAGHLGDARDGHF